MFSLTLKISVLFLCKQIKKIYSKHLIFGLILFISVLSLCRYIREIHKTNLNLSSTMFISVISLYRLYLVYTEYVSIYLYRQIEEMHRPNPMINTVYFYTISIQIEHSINTGYLRTISIQIDQIHTQNKYYLQFNHRVSIEWKSPYKESYKVNSHRKSFDYVLSDVCACVRFQN